MEQIPAYMTIAELLEKLGFPPGASGRESLRSQIYRWCRSREEPRDNRPNPSARRAKLVEGIHWTVTGAPARRVFTRDAYTAVKILRGMP